MGLRDREKSGAKISKREPRRWPKNNRHVDECDESIGWDQQILLSFSSLENLEGTRTLTPKERSPGHVPEAWTEWRGGSSAAEAVVQAAVWAGRAEPQGWLTAETWNMASWGLDSTGQGVWLFRNLGQGGSCREKLTGPPVGVVTQEEQRPGALWDVRWMLGEYGHPDP